MSDKYKKYLFIAAISFIILAGGYYFLIYRNRFPVVKLNSVDFDAKTANLDIDGDNVVLSGGLATMVRGYSIMFEQPAADGTVSKSDILGIYKAAPDGTMVLEQTIATRP